LDNSLRTCGGRKEEGRMEGERGGEEEGGREVRRRTWESVGGREGRMGGREGGK